MHAPDQASDSQDQALPPALGRALEGFGAHLALELGRSAHTVRAYTGDIRRLLAFAAAAGVQTLEDLDLSDLRWWLAQEGRGGRSRSTVARRAAAARVFTAWAARRGLASTDVGDRLASPTPHRALPPVLSQRQAASLMHVAGLAADDADPTHLRDRALVEILYATGIRVGELVGLDLDDVDDSRATLRVLGKGAKERTVPYGAPAAQALAAWRERGRPAVLTPDSWPALFLGARGRRLDQIGRAHV